MDRRRHRLAQRIHAETEFFRERWIPVSARSWRQTPHRISIEIRQCAAGGRHLCAATTASMSVAAPVRWRPLKRLLSLKADAPRRRGRPRPTPCPQTASNAV